LIGILRSVFIAIILSFVVSVISYYSYYEIEEHQQVVITQFGKILKANKNPGKYFKLPFIQNAIYFPKGPLSYESGAQIPTLDKKFVQVDAKTHYKIFDPITFFQTVNNEFNAKIRVADIVEPAIRNIITSQQLRVIILPINSHQKIIKKRCNAKIEGSIEEISKRKLKRFGISLIKIEALVTYPI